MTTSVNGRSNPRFRTSPGSGVVKVGITSGSLPFALEAVAPLGKLVLYLLAREGKVTDAHAQVVGVPKPKDPGSTRPIAMASALVRGFHRALLSQFLCRPSSGVVFLAPALQMPLLTGLRCELTEVLSLTYAVRLTAFPMLFPFLQDGL